MTAMGHKPESLKVNKCVPLFLGKRTFALAVTVPIKSCRDRASPTYSRSHRRAGIGVFFLMMTHARLRRSPSSASNSARPQGDGSAVGQGHRAARRIDGRDKVCLDQ
jgi:hypothetical protein